MAVCMKKIDEETLKHLHALFIAAYHIAKKNRPYTDFGDIIVMLGKFDITRSEQYVNEKRCQEFISYIAEDLRNTLLKEIKESSFVTILLDGSTDRSSTEDLILYARYVKEGKVKETFLSVTPLEETTGSGYLKALQEELSNLGLQTLLTGNILVGIGTDGAASMTGVHCGLVSQLSTTVEKLVKVHCVAHQLQLTVLQSLKHVKFIEEVDSVLKRLYTFYRHSPKRLRELKNVSELLECEIVKLQYLHQVRWVASKLRALHAVIKDWKCLVVHLENIAEKKGEEASVATGIVKKIKDFRFVVTIHFLHDFLSVFKSLSLVFQRENLVLSQIIVHVKRSINSLDELKNENGLMENKFISETSVSEIFCDIQLANITNRGFSSDKEKILNNGIKFLTDRFLENENLHTATGVFDTFSWPSGKFLETYGEKEIKLLATHFEAHLNAEENFMNMLLNEWYEFKVLGQGLNLTDLLMKVTSLKERFPILEKLLKIVATLPVSTSSCERGFSIVNVIKDKFRSNLTVKNLCDLMMISLNGPPMRDFNPQRSIDRWYYGAKTKRHI